jgi:hypothetical protein
MTRPKIYVNADSSEPKARNTSIYLQRLQDYIHEGVTVYGGCKVMKLKDSLEGPKRNRKKKNISPPAFEINNAIEPPKLKTAKL